MSVGVDIVKISRMEKLLQKGIPSKIFSEEEAEYILSRANRAQAAAGIFAAKEAFLKTCGAGIFSSELNQICVKHLKGAPFLSVEGSALELAQKLGLCSFELSISHDGEYAAAVVTACEDKYLRAYKKAVSVYCHADEGVITPDLVRALLPKRNSEVHKGSCGKIFAVAGSKGMTGAAIMACTSALKCGAGLITLGCADSLNTIFEIALREIMTMPLSDTSGSINAENAPLIADEAQKADVLLIGPGLGRKSSVGKIVREVLQREGICAVADADALNAISENLSCLKNHRASLILTPHIGEFARLTGLNAEEILKDTKKYAVEFAEKYNVTLVLKSHRTVTASPEKACLVNISGNPGMATGGTGDVLAGAVASFAAQGLKPYDAANAGVYIHSLAADMAVSETGEYSLTPSDILSCLPFALKFSTGR